MNDTVLKIADKLLAEKQMLAVAESCTGGYISHLITAVGGSSQWFSGGVVSYSNEMKRNILGVKADTLENFGAVSEQTVREMVCGILKITNADLGIAVSGIAGPAGGTAEKPVGTVWIAVGDRTEVVVREFHFSTNRMENIKASANEALDLLLKLKIRKEELVINK